MQNMYEDIRTSPRFNKLAIGDLLFAEYTCPIEADYAGVWVPTDYMVHVISGKKTWRTTDGSWSAEAGETLYIRKGSAIVEQSFAEDFCLLLFFIPDDLVRDVVSELAEDLPATSGVSPPSTALRVTDDTALTAFFRSMMTYFSGTEKPSEPLLRLELKELIFGVLTSP